MQSSQLFSTSKSTLTVTQLADFAASMTYLMWHARKPSTSVTTNVERSFSNSAYGNDMSYLMWQAKKPSTRVSPMDDYTMTFTASLAFKKFCYQVLSATQLKESAVYLCLKYIANLLQINPSIEGAEGSEYRLFVVALMLANKFLDDNTYTNKTWSEVSGMKVHDLNVMEAEFLEAIDFNLYIRAQDFAVWKILLESCRQRYSISYTDTVQERQKAIYNTLHTLGLYDNQFSQFVIHKQQPTTRNVFQEKEEEPDHIARITGLLDRSYKKYLASVEHQERQRKTRVQWDDPRTRWQQQQQQYQQPPYYHSYQTQRRNDQEQLLAPNQLPINLQPPAVRYGGYSNACRYANRKQYPITNLSQKSWDPLAYSLRCQGSYSNVTNDQHLNSARPISWKNF
ncbi:hypothetical protein G6F62_009247 [Rhizopus arrhizus]|nr:hypothetical protein G6F62_009247 [Rhizopus arrhizus]